MFLTSEDRISILNSTSSSSALTSSSSTSTTASSLLKNSNSGKDGTSSKSFVAEKPLTCQVQTNHISQINWQAQSKIAFVVNSTECIYNLFVEALLRIRTWIGFSVSAFWTTLNFLNHFIETKAIHWFIPLSCGRNINRSDNNIRPAELDDSQLGWQKALMISFYDQHSRQQKQQPEFSPATINSNFLSVNNRAQNWNEEAAAALIAIQRHHDKHPNNSWSKDCIALHNRYYNNCNMEEYWGRILQRAASDALRIQRHRDSEEASTRNGSDDPNTRGLKKEVSGSLRSMQQQQHQQTPMDFQGQNRCSGPQAGSNSTQPEKEFALQHKYHHKQEQQKPQAPTLEQRLEIAGNQQKNLLKYPPYCARQANLDDRLENDCNQSSAIHQKNKEKIDKDGNASLVLVSQSTLSNLTEQIAFSMNKMKDLEEKVRVIPELQRRLDDVITDGSLSRVGSSRSSNLGISNTKYLDDSNNLKYANSVDNFNINGHIRNSLKDRDDLIPFKAMHSTPLRQAYGGSMRYSPGLRVSAATMQQCPTGLPRTSSLNMSSPYSDKLAKFNGDHRRQSPDVPDTLRSTQESLNGIDLGSSKVEYEDLINDLISLSYSVNYLSDNTTPFNQSSNDNRLQPRKTYAHKPERPDPMQQSKQHFPSNNKNQCSNLPSNINNTYQSNSHNTNMNHNQYPFFNSNNGNHFTRSNNNNTPKFRNNNGSGSFSLQTTPVKTHLDCGCQSIKEHLRYNSFSREQRLNATKSHLSIPSTGSNNSSTNVSPQPSSSQKTDASTNTELSMNDIVTRVEFDKLVTKIHNSYSNLSPLNLERDIRSKTIGHSSSSPSDESSGSPVGPNSTTQTESQSMSSGDERLYDHGTNIADLSGTKSVNSDVKLNLSTPKEQLTPRGSLSDVELSAHDKMENDDDEESVNINSIEGVEEACSLGSSYQDPSDFEEYCAYGESLDRRTKEFMSQSTKIPNDLRFALIRLNDSIKKKRTLSQIRSSSNCIDVIRKEWFSTAAVKDAHATKTKMYVDYFESFTKQVLNVVVNLSDEAGNTAMHYAASHFRLDIIEILLATRICDVNCRNKAGYTPIMLLALANLEDNNDQEVARRLFNLGDANIKARSSGQTALMLAASHGRVITCKLLLDCGADPSLQDYDGSTALMCGSELGNEDVVRCLLTHKLTDPNTTDNDGLDALTIAMNNGHKNIGLILYAAKNVPRMTRSSVNPNNPRPANTSSSYLGASLRRSRGKFMTNHVRRTDSLLDQRCKRSARHFDT